MFIRYLCQQSEISSCVRITLAQIADDLFLCVFSTYYFIAGLLVDLCKESLQAAAKGTSWSTVPATQAHVHMLPTAITTSTTTTLSAEWPAPLPWLRECVDSSLRPPGKKSGFPLKKVFRPVPPKIVDGESVEPAVTDIDELSLVRAVQRSHEGQQSEVKPGDEDSFLDLRTGTTKIDADKHTEVREAMPFMWAGRSPFWSPLVLQRFLIEPLKDIIEFASPDKVC